MPTAEILSQGDEVITGQIVDSNAAWLSDRLTDLGLDVVRHTAVGDRLDDIVEVFSGARADVIVCTGGLGPTDDDLTAEAAARAFHRPLQFDDEAWAQIQAMFERFRRPIPDINRKQAWLPAGAARLDNPVGTAPGFAVETSRGGLLLCLPGVPHEMKRMFDDAVLPRVVERLALRPGRLVTLHTTGIGESALQERIEAGQGPFRHPGVVLGYRTTPGENLVKLRASPDCSDADLAALVALLRDRIGTPLFSVEGLPGEDGGDLIGTIARLLVERGATLAVAESCTGGLVASTCTALAGASRWFIEGVVAYANEAKTRHLGVDPALIAAHGAVSEPVARAMAEGLRQRSGATFALATTGVAGPDGGTPDKPVGTVHLALATPERTVHRLARLGGSRARIQAHAAAGVLDLLRRHLQGIALS
ncbi:MAG TPA: competence/damage-inducible protein A [Myxococcota bacterium]|nr:competence/damage-inducible protein A [Myxococcota bacterium]